MITIALRMPDVVESAGVLQFVFGNQYSYLSLVQVALNCSPADF